MPGFLFACGLKSVIQCVANPCHSSFSPLVGRRKSDRPDEGQARSLHAVSYTHLDVYKRQKEEARKALLEQFKPAYERVIAWSEEELPNAAVNATGVGSTHANGKAYYEYQLRQMTTTNMTADQIHELGLKEVERIKGCLLYTSRCV